MIRRYNRWSLLFGISGLIVQFAGLFQANPEGRLTVLGEELLLVGAILVIIGLAFYAKAKGQSPAWCLVGLLSIIGVIILALLKDESTVNRDAGEEHVQA